MEHMGRGVMGAPSVSLPLDASRYTHQVFVSAPSAVAALTASDVNANPNKGNGVVSTCALSSTMHIRSALG